MITVFGSINVDLVLKCAKLPQCGETVLAHASFIAPGGKGANQAHAAARLGATVHLVGAVGNDAMAETALSLLKVAGVDIGCVAQFDGTTGCASVAVSDAGDNQIIVASGANAQVTAAMLPDSLLATTQLLVLQMELPFAATHDALTRARAAGVKTMLNNAPALALPLATLRLIDVLVVNEGEFAVTVGALEGEAFDGVESQLTALARAIGATVVLTRGEHGVWATTAQGELHKVAGHVVQAVDTTGAGDTFCGAFAVAMVDGFSLVQTLAQANACAALACTEWGAQAAQPTRVALNTWLQEAKFNSKSIASKSMNTQTNG